MKCYHCGAELPESAHFCGACGADQSQQPAAQAACIHCGKDIESNARFCPHCGMTQESPAPAEAEPEIAPAAQEPEIQEPQPETEMPEEAPAEELTAEEPAAEEEMTPEPEAEPEIIPEPEPEPAAIEEPEPLPEPEPVPAPQPVPPQPAPQSEPAPQPAPAPVQPQPQYYTPQPAQQPVYQNPYSQPAYQPAYQPQQNIQVNLGGVMPQRSATPTYVQPQAPAYKLPCQRGMLKMIFLSLLTLGIYPLVIYSRMSMEINMVASRHDGKYTIHFMWLPILTGLTLGIYPFIWIHQLCDRIGGELERRQIQYRFNAASFWLWNLVYGFVATLISAVATYVLYEIVKLDVTLVILIASALVLISSIGPLVFLHKHMKSMNLINADYNRRG